MPPETSTQRIPSGGLRPRVIFVDDDEDIRHLVKQALSPISCEFVEAPDAIEALALLKAAPNGYALMITDVMMPHMDGLTLVRNVRKFAPLLPIVLISGHLTEDDLWLPELHDVPLLTKPFSIVTICALVRDTLMHSQAALPRLGDAGVVPPAR